jgi:transglutaminase-like putative cysteine protease
MPLHDRPEPFPADAPPVTLYRCRHVTRYDYGEDVPVSHHRLHLTPRPHPRQTCRSAAITVLPAPSVRVDHTDHFGNVSTYVAVQEPHRSLTIIAESDVAVSAPPPLDPLSTPPWEAVRDRLHALSGPDAAAEVVQFAFDSALVQVSPELAAYAAPSFPAGRPVADAALDLMRRIHGDFAFDPTATTVATPLGVAFANRRGVCQDFAHVLVGCLRAQGLPARYVSGYLRTLPPPGKPRLIGADVSHAWASVWCGDGPWLDLCPTNGRPADQDFITLAWGRDYGDVSPVRGVILSGAGHTLSVEVDVEPVE